jgi:hypothetical protein
MQSNPDMQWMMNIKRVMRQQRTRSRGMQCNPNVPLMMNIKRVLKDRLHHCDTTEVAQVEHGRRTCA